VGLAGTLAGTGTINGNVNVLGAFSPGNPATAPFGTLTVNGNLTFASTSVFNVQTDIAGHNGKIAVVGASHTATIDGIVSVMTGGGEYLPSTDYTLITAQGGLTGEFADISTDYEFLTPTLSYDANNVYLNLSRNDVGFATVAQTGNQLASANYLESVSRDTSITRLVNKILNLNATDARTAFANIGGDGLVQFGRISHMQTSRFMEALATRLAGGIPGGGSFGVDRTVDTAQLTASEASWFQTNTTDRGLWMRSFGMKGDMPGNADAVGADWRSGGTAIGFDAPVTSNLAVGTSFMYGNNVAQLNEGRGGNARIKSPALATYASYSSAGDATTGWQLRGLVGYAQPTISSARNVTIGDDTSVASSKHIGREVSLAGEAEVSRNMHFFRLQGMVGLRASRLREEGFTETGSLADLEVSGRTTQSLTSSVGTRVLVPTYYKEGLIDVRAVWSRQLGSLASPLTAKLADADSSERFTVDGMPDPRDSLLLGVGFSGKLKRNLSFYGDYSLLLSGAGQRESTGFAGLRMVW
jgi:outer membrane autotransporter protein